MNSYLLGFEADEDDDTDFSADTCVLGLELDNNDRLLTMGLRRDVTFKLPLCVTPKLALLLLTELPVVEPMKRSRTVGVLDNPLALPLALSVGIVRPLAVAQLALLVLQVLSLKMLD
jgi:hypothetical protein